MSTIEKEYAGWFIKKICEIDYLSIFDEVVKSRVDTKKHPRSIWYHYYFNLSDNSSDKSIANESIHEKMMMIHSKYSDFKLEDDLKTLISKNIDETIDTKIDLIAYNNDKLSDETIEKVKSAIKRQAESWIHPRIDALIQPYSKWFLGKLQKEFDDDKFHNNYLKYFKLRMLEIKPDIKEIFRLWDLYLRYFIKSDNMPYIYYHLINPQFDIDLKTLFRVKNIDRTIDTRIDINAYYNDKLSDDTINEINEIKSAIKRRCQFMIDDHFDEFRKMYF